ncbi:TetR/AcrR family transcriptional regulator [Streptomyces sp. AcE210]|uniref:TetR/AcrR family transcriptional regulator n=1 Tax=Streptomyces sp. AcE210 TaxID=2292703 RepID=UPI000E307050|nr:TetR/AcrR family transcriptional regulator [Streptomyces sp. AcE210]RFC76625.1 TetR/AcrR family transcriptional regulator [Streptomyces sp. AcE210]
MSPAGAARAHRTAEERSRPRDRKARILAVAVELFHRHGYAATSMEDIAAESGVTAGALYRHFPGKRELLGRALAHGLDGLLAGIGEAADLTQLLDVAAHFTLDRRGSTVLWQREARHLSDADRAEVERGHAQAARTVSTALRTAAGEQASGRDLDLVAWGCLAVLASPSYHHTALTRPRFDELLVSAAAAVCRTDIQRPLPAPGPVAPVTGMLPRTRHEALLAAALPLFSAHGFDGVGLEDVARAVGMSRAAVYAHYDGKADLLTAVLRRESEAAWYALNRALAESASAGEALERVLRAYAVSATMSRGLAGLLVSEVPRLPGEQRESAHRTQLLYVAEWVALLRACRPELDECAARVAVHASLTLVNVLSRRPEVRRHAHPADALTDLGLSVLHGTGSGTGPVDGTEPGRSRPATTTTATRRTSS